MGVTTLPKIIGVTELQRRFRAVLDDVVRERSTYVLMRGSRPEAALVPYDEFERYQRLRDEEELKRFDRLLARMAGQSAQYAEDEVAADVAAARAERSA